METVTIQKLEKLTQDNFSTAQSYYAILSTLNNLQLTEREIQLIAFSAIRGSISYATVREEFCTKYNSSFPTVNNIVSKLKRSHIFIKQGKYIVVNPAIALDFSKPLVLQITLTINTKLTTNGETNEHALKDLSNKKAELETQHL